MSKNIKSILIVFISIFIFSISFVLYSSSSAFFKVGVQSLDNNHVVSVNNLFDKLNVPNTTKIIYDNKLYKYNTENNIAHENDKDYFLFDEDADFGSSHNPYIVNNYRHLYNLSVLQKIGYFNNKTKDEDQYRFLVCTNVGNPTSVNCQHIKMQPIGNEEFPFISFFSGAYTTLENTTNVIIADSYSGESAQTINVEFKNETQTITKTVNTSTIYNLDIVAPTTSIDIGLFGSVSYLGELTSDENNITTIDGYMGTIKNLVVADISIESTDTMVENITSWWANANFVFHKDTATEIHHTSNESHHIGIITGHAENCSVENISVYYSGFTPAFKLQSLDSNNNQTNFYSSTGILGYLVNCNREVSYNSEGEAVYGQGISEGNISHDASGGGGNNSGILTGYMLAESIFNNTNNNDSSITSYDLIACKDINGENLCEHIDMDEGNWWDKLLGNKKIPRTTFLEIEFLRLLFLQTTKKINLNKFGILPKTICIIAKKR